MKRASQSILRSKNVACHDVRTQVATVTVTWQRCLANDPVAHQKSNPRDRTRLRACLGMGEGYAADVRPADCRELCASGAKMLMFNV